MNRTSPLLVSTISAARYPDLSAVKRRFDGNGLPWDTKIETYLFGLGVGCSKHLKMLETIEIDGMLQHHPPITQRVSRRVFKYLKSSGKYDPKKCAHELGIKQDAARRLSESMNS